MGTIKSFYHQGTPDCPVDVSYFSPYHIHEAPGLTETSSKLRFSLITGGQVELRTGGKLRILNTGDIFILLPNDVFTFRSTSMDTKYVFIEFGTELIALPSGHFFQENFVKPLQDGKLKMPRLIRPGDDLYPGLHRELSRLDVKKEGSDAYTAELFAIAIGLCAALMPYCKTATPKEISAKAGEDLIYTCLEYIKQNYSKKLTLRELADLVHLQPNYLCTLFKERTGRTVFDHITRLRINSTSKLLRSTNMPVNQIAERCGFPNTSFFTRKFTALHGCSPTAYRKQFAARELSDME